MPPDSTSHRLYKNVIEIIYLNHVKWDVEGWIKGFGIRVSVVKLSLLYQDFSGFSTNENSARNLSYFWKHKFFFEVTFFLSKTLLNDFNTVNIL